MIDAFGCHIIDWNGPVRNFVLRLGSFANLFADSCFFGRFECTCFCASFDDILSLKRYAVFTNSYFPQSQIHSFDLQPDKVSQVHTYCRPCLKYHVHSIAKLGLRD